MHFLGSTRDTVVTFAASGDGAASSTIVIGCVAAAALAVLAAIYARATLWRIFVGGGLYSIPALMMMAALAPWPYAYYELLRVITLVCLGLAMARQERNSVALAICLILAVIYNPVLPLHFTRGVWQILNVASAAALFALAIAATRPAAARAAGAEGSRLSQ